MNAIGNNVVAPYRPSYRIPGTRPVEGDYGTPPQPKVAEGFESLSLQTRIDISQKAQAAPPPPPQETKRKSSTPAERRKEQARPEEAQVSTSDFTGRTATGTLNGPLLMEDPLASDSSESRVGSFRTVDFKFESSEDFASVRSAGAALGSLTLDQLYSPAGESPVAVVPVQDSQFHYLGIQDGSATLVEMLDHPVEPSQSRVVLPNGQQVEITRGAGDGSQISVRIPALSLDDLACWGRDLLAVA